MATKKTPRKDSKKPQGAPVRVHVYYSGRVQGVGFRYTAERLALDLGLTGWVKNLQDGRVELIGEGPEATVKALLTQIQESNLGPHIRNADIRWEPSTGEFSDFTVEFIL